MSAGSINATSNEILSFPQIEGIFSHSTVGSQASRGWGHAVNITKGETKTIIGLLLSSSQSRNKHTYLHRVVETQQQHLLRCYLLHPQPYPGSTLLPLPLLYLVFNPQP